jgi:hypothetical protein
VAALAERIAAKTDTSGDHHRWLGATGADGTPQIRIDGRLTTVRRVIWEQAHGPLPDGATVAACPDDARCVRLGHLSLGRKDRMSAPVQTPTPRQRGRRGAGSMREVRPGVWELSFSDMGTRRYRTIRGTRSDAASALAAFTGEVTGRYDTVDALVLAYLAHLDAQGRSPATIRRYRQLWRHWLSPTVAQVEPSRLQPHDLEGAVAAMADAGQSPSSVHQAAILLSGCFAWAARQGTLGRNPAFGLRLPNGNRLAAPRFR